MGTDDKKEDTSMADADKDTKETDDKNKDEEVEEEEKEPEVPPLEAAALRLEKSLGAAEKGGASSYSYYSNPAKVVRRWLSTSSGAAGEASLPDISSAAKALFDPEITTDLDLLVAEGGDDMVTEKAESETEEKKYLKSASLEVQAWLMSLKVRLLWREKEFDAALELCQKGIMKVMNKLDQESGSVASLSSLFPLSARLWRWYALIVETATPSDPNKAAMLRLDMTKAHNMTLLRRDVDTAATLLNCMLRDLLLNSQGTHERMCDE